MQSIVVHNLHDFELLVGVVMADDLKNKYLKRLRELLRRLDGGKNVAPRDLEKWLSDEQIQAWQNEVLQIRDLDDEWQTRPSEFDGYIELLKKADFAFSKGDKISAKASAARTKAPSSASKLMRSADGYFEKATEKLQEILEKKPELVVWLDRPLEEAGIDPVSIPRLKTSKAHHAEDTYKSTKRQEFRDAKRKAVLAAIEEIENPQTPMQIAEPEKTAAEQLRRLKNLTGR